MLCPLIQRQILYNYKFYELVQYRNVTYHCIFLYILELAAWRTLLSATFVIKLSS